MNVSFSATRLLLLMVFFNQFSWGMKEQLALICPEQNKCEAINPSEVYKVPAHGFNDYDDEIKFFLGAVYFKLHDTVESTLNSSSRRSHCYYFNSNNYGVLEAYDIARRNKDQKMVDLLRKYKHNECYSLEDKPTDLMISFYVRDIGRIKNIIKTTPPHLHTKNSVEDSLTLLVERKDIECINLLLSCESIRNIIDYYYFIRLLDKISRQDKMDEVIEALLASGCYRFHYNPLREKSSYDKSIEKYIVKK